MSSANTARLTAFVKHASTMLFHDKRVRILWLTGSLVTGKADAWSDIDFRVAVRAEDLATLDVWWQDTLDSVTPLAWKQCWPGEPGEFLLTAISQEYLRFDVVVQSLIDTRPRTLEAIRLIFDKDGVAPQFLLTTPSQHNPLARLPFIVEEFIRLLGTLPLVVGRNDIPVGMEEQMNLHSLLLDLLLFENDREQTDVIRRHALMYLSEEQKNILQHVPLLAPSIETIIQGRIAYARLFLPRARRLLKLHGLAYPESFETATRRYLWETLQINI